MVDPSAAPLVSVVMPVYKVEAYVGRAIESVLGQTLWDWELFCVDDGSPDRSGAICEEYAARDPRITVLHRANGGAPSARNAAMEIARGRYFFFMDSDDRADPDMLESMVGLAEENRADLVIAGFFIETHSGGGRPFVQVQSAGPVDCSSHGAFRQNAHRLLDRNLLYPPWNKLFRASYLRERGIRFPDTFWDDFPFNLAVIRDVERVVATPKAWYRFQRQRAESETAKYRPGMFERREEENRWLLDLYARWGTMSPEARETIARRHVERLVGCLENEASPACPRSPREKRARIRKMLAVPSARESFRHARPRSLHMRLLLLPVRMRWTWGCYLEGTLLSFVRRRFGRLFARLKASR